MASEKGTFTSITLADQYSGLKCDTFFVMLLAGFSVRTENPVLFAGAGTLFDPLKFNSISESIAIKS